MKLRSFAVLFACAVAFGCAGCKNPPGRPMAGDEAERPDQVLDFPTLYKQNCAACHGANGHDGAAISLANPVYLSFVGVSNIERVTATGVAGTLMPPFSKSNGGMLTDQQVEVLAEGMMTSWDKGGAPVAIAYASTLHGDAARGQAAYATFCARCHGADGSGTAVGQIHTGSIVDPAYLALISDQGLRSILVAGKPDEGMPDWAHDATGNGARAMSDQEITDIVAWLAGHRSTAPGQPYAQHQ